MVNYFDIFAISEHTLFEEQSDILIVPLIYLTSGSLLAQKTTLLSYLVNQHMEVLLCLEISIDDLVTPLENIDSDRIVGIRCDIPDSDPLFILSVYLPASNH